MAIIPSTGIQTGISREQIELGVIGLVSAPIVLYGCALLYACAIPLVGPQIQIF